MLCILDQLADVLIQKLEDSWSLALISSDSAVESADVASSPSS